MGFQPMNVKPNVSPVVLECETCNARGTLGDGEFVKDETASYYMRHPVYWHEPCGDADFDGESWTAFGRAEEAA